MMQQNDGRKFVDSKDALCGREPISADILRLSSNLASRAEELAEKLGTKLSPVTTFPETSCEPAGKNARPEWPPLFNDLRYSFDNISSALDQIEDTIRRTEL